MLLDSIAQNFLLRVKTLWKQCYNHQNHSNGESFININKLFIKWSKLSKKGRRFLRFTT